MVKIQYQFLFGSDPRDAERAKYLDKISRKFTDGKHGALRHLIDRAMLIDETEKKEE